MMNSKVNNTSAGNRKVWIFTAIGVAVLLVLLATLAIAGQEKILQCERLSNGQANCVIKKSILGIITLNSKTLTGARSITINEQCVGSDCKYRLEVYADQGVVPVNDSFTSNYNQLLDAYTRFDTFFSNTSNTNMQLSERTNPILIVGVAAISVLIWIYLGILSWQVTRKRA